MNSKVFKTLEWDKVIAMLVKHAATSLGKVQVEELAPYSTYDEILIHQAETDEACTILRLKGSAPFGGIRDIRSAIARARIGGGLSGHELVDISTTVHGSRRLKKFILAMAEAEPVERLAGWAEPIVELKPMEDEINLCLDDQGEVLDSASSELRRLRHEIRSAEQRVKDRLEQMIRNNSTQKMLQETLITTRNGRYVLPVKQEYRGVFGGIIHDQSASGATLFIEPEAVVALTNQLRETKLKEEREIERILLRLSGLVAQSAEELSLNISCLAHLDFVFAKASLAGEMKAIRPVMNEEHRLRLRKARHPLIPREIVVPTDVELGASFSSLIITGPNTGGKTVTLKTIGLLSIMAMAGLQVPAEEGSELCLFTEIFADIGDEQSIEQNLSTFSSHMTNIIDILAKFGADSLVLFDELGAGTDPTEGAALAMAILDHVHEIGARLVATTHYSELKAYAYDRPGVMNASVEFDVASLSPTYRLLVGVPGRSNAFAISERLGLSKEIIAKAKSEVKEEDVQVEKMIASLEANRKKAEAEKIHAEALKREAETLRKQYEDLQKRFELDKERLLKQAMKEADDIVKKAKQEAEEVIAELRRMSLERKSGVKEHEFIELKRRLDQAVPTPAVKPSSAKKKIEKIEPGDEVQVASLGQKGFVVELLSGGEALVQIGIMKMKVKLNDLSVVQEKKAEKQVHLTSVKRAKEDVRAELDLRGTNVEEAIVEIDRYLSEAMLAGYHQIHLIHGKGTGVLRIGVQDYLSRNRLVKSYRNGSFGEGGNGVTVVELK